MRWRRTGPTALLCALTLWPAAEASFQQSHTIWDGVYEPRQAREGKGVYLASCAGCHGENLDGAGPAGALAGPTFLQTWDKKTLADLYSRIYATMPQDAPASLTPAEYVATIAFVLESNEAPPGSKPLSADVAALKAIMIAAER